MMLNELVTPLYAAIGALLFVALSIRTIRLRREAAVAIGPGDNQKLARAIRAHGNCAEYLPLALLLLLMAELSGMNTIATHALCALLLTGRLIHAYGISNERENYRFRVTGMAITFTVVIAAALYLLASYF